MTRRRRPAGDRGMASARAATSQSNRTRDTAAPEAATRQLPLPLPSDPQPRVAAPPAVPPVEAPSLASARALRTPPHSSARAAAPGNGGHPTAETERDRQERHGARHQEPHGDLRGNGHGEDHGELRRGERAPQARPSQPSGPRESRPAHAHLDDVRSALADGWEIVQPIFARPLWSVSDDSATAFNFVLRRERATRLVTVPEGRGVQRFIRDHHLAVDYRA